MLKGLVLNFQSSWIVRCKILSLTFNHLGWHAVRPVLNFQSSWVLRRAMPGALRALDVSFVAAPSGAQLRSTVGCSYLRVCRGILLGFTACKFSRLNQDPPDITTSADPIEDWHPIPEFFPLFSALVGSVFFLFLCPFSSSLIRVAMLSCAQLRPAGCVRLASPKLG